MDSKSHMKENEELERIVGLMEEGRQLSDEELASLMQDDEAMKACRDFYLMKGAVMEQCDDALDVDAEWNRFHRKSVAPAIVQKSVEKKKSGWFLWGAFSGAAASLLIVLCYIWYNGHSFLSDEFVAFQAIDSIQTVTLQTSEGKRILLDCNTQEETITFAGASLHKKDTLELAYANQPSMKQEVEEVEMHRLSTPRGKDFKIVLEDGTEVWMNAESSLEYPSKFEGKRRRVRLKGEAYFKVAKNAECPFVIATDRMQVQVLGTELNVRNYVEKESHVTLINGKVKVADNENQENFVCLKPGEDAHLDADHTFTVKEVDTEAYVYWKEGYFYFDDMPLADVVQELGRWYNINVIFENKELMDLRIRYFCVRSETLERAVNLLNRMKKMNVTLSGNTVYIR